MKLLERNIQLSWKTLKPGTTLKTINGTKIKILSTGTWNFEEGPDFLDAKFEIESKTYRGDVEVHIKASDWLQHGHGPDPRYNQVKLHIVTKNDTAEIRPDMHTIIFGENSIYKRLQETQNMKFGRGECKKFFAAIENNTLSEFFLLAGVQNFLEKAQKAAAEIIREGSEPALLKRIFEAAGYKKNKENFIELFRRVSEHPDFANPKILPALIWGESDFLPDPTIEKVHLEMQSYAGELWTIWWKHRIEKKAPIKWLKSGVRPLNSPERRIAGLCSLLSKTGIKIFSKIEKIILSAKSPKDFSINLINLFTVNDPIWDKWTNFRDKRNFNASVIGKMRAIDIIINVVLPFIYAKFAIEKKHDLADFCIETFKNTERPQDNIKIKSAANKWLEPPSRINSLIHNAAEAQGVIYIFKNFCSTNSSYCPECKMLKELKSTQSN